MSQNKRYYKIYNYKEIYSEFESHLKKNINEDSTVNNYIKYNMNKYSDDELEVMRESTLKYKELNSFAATVGISALTAIFTLFSILVATAVALSGDNGLRVKILAIIFIILCIYALMIWRIASYFFKKEAQIIKTANLLDIAIRLRKNKIKINSC